MTFRKFKGRNGDLKEKNGKISAGLQAMINYEKLLTKIMWSKMKRIHINK